MNNKHLSYSVSGFIKNRPFNCLVRAYDHDLLQNELLGQSIVRDDGSFEIKFSSNDFVGKIIPLDKKPDIYLSLYNNDGKCIHTTTVFKNVSDEHFRIDITLEEEFKPEVPATEGKIEVNRELLNFLKHKDIVNAYSLLLNPDAEVENKAAIVKVFPKILIDGYINLGQYDDLFRDIVLDRQMIVLPEQISAVYFSAIVPDDLLTFQTEHISVTYQEHPFREIPGNTNHFFRPPADINYQVDDISRQVLIGVVKASSDTFNDEVHAQYMQKIGLAAEYAYSKFMQYGFKDPMITHPGRIAIISTPPLSVNETELGRTHTAYSTPVIWIVSTLNDRDLFIAVLHEVFHLIQFQYRQATTIDIVGFARMITEGGATFVEDCFLDSSNNYMRTSDREIFRRRLYPMTPPIPNPDEYSYIFSQLEKTVAYGGALLWKYMATLYSQLHYSDSFQGIDVQRKLLESIFTSTGGYSIDVLRTFYKKLTVYGTFDGFKWSSGHNGQHLISQENAWGNYLMAKYLHTIMKVSLSGSNYDARFDFFEDNQSFRDQTGITTLEAIAPRVELTGLVGVGNNVSRGGKLDPYQVKYYEIKPDQSFTPDEYEQEFSSRMLRFEFTVTSPMVGDVQVILKLILIRKARPDDELQRETIQDIFQTEDRKYFKLINLKNLSKIVVIVASKEKPFEFSFVPKFENNSDTMITRWNCMPGKEYEINPANHSWTWLSPDIIVDNNDDLLDDGAVYSNLPEGQSNKLKVRIRNKGNLKSLYKFYDINVYVQKMTNLLDGNRWGLLSTVESVQSPEPGQEQWYEIPWVINGDGVMLEDWSVKVTITQRYPYNRNDDESLDNKEAITQFASVKPYTVPFVMRKTCKMSLAGCGDLLFIPRDRLYTINRNSYPVSIKRNIFDVRPGEFFSENIRLDIEKVEGAMKAWEGPSHPDVDTNGYYFPVNKEALPPAVMTENMVTVTQVVDGTAVGGATYRISEKKIK